MLCSDRFLMILPNFPQFNLLSEAYPMTSVVFNDDDAVIIIVLNC